MTKHVKPRHAGPATNPEADLDLQYLMGISPGAETWFFEQGADEWLLALLDAVDALDVPPWVVSISYSWREALQCYTAAPRGPMGECMKMGYSAAAYTNRANTVFQKLGARGVTIIAASGDRGAAGASHNCPLRTTALNQCPQIELNYRNHRCFFPEGCEELLSAGPDCAAALDKLKLLGPEKGCTVQVSGTTGAGASFFSSTCTCDALFSGNPLVQHDECVIRAYDYSPASGAELSPGFPASSPFVTSVGATLLARAPVPACKAGNVLCPRGEVAASGDLGVPVTSGGGFSMLSAAPAYQKDHVAKYLARVDGAALPPKGRYRSRYCCFFSVFCSSISSHT